MHNSITKIIYVLCASSKEGVVYTVFYTWDSEDEEFQYWQECQFESLDEAREFVASLANDGVAVTRIINN